MICFGTGAFLYFFIGWVVSYEAYKRNWNDELNRYEKGGNFQWFLFWPWYVAIYISKHSDDPWARLGARVESITSDLFERMMNFEWRKHGTEDESTEGS